MFASRSRHSPLISRLAGWPRRTLAVACLLLAVASLLLGRTGRADRAASSAPAATLATVLVAARPLAAGTVLDAADLRALAWPESLAPATVLADAHAAIGRTVGAAMARGEPLTASRLLDTSISAALSRNQVAVTVNLQQQSRASILSAGALVDLYAAGAAGRPLVSAARVLAVLAPSAAAQDGPLSVVLAVSRAEVGRLAGQPIETILATLRPAHD
jgi:Flp pilus assembly protein CpaB